MRRGGHADYAKITRMTAFPQPSPDNYRNCGNVAEAHGLGHHSRDRGCRM